MRKEDFNKLKIVEQVEYINQNLESKSLTELCNKIKISRSTIRERFLKYGYVFNKSSNKYLHLESNKVDYKENKYKDNTNLLETKINTLELKVEAIEKILNEAKSKHKISIKKFEGETVSRCYRLYENIQKDFVLFCKKNNELKIQDILSMALYEYMENNS